MLSKRISIIILVLAATPLLALFQNFSVTDEPGWRYGRELNAAQPFDVLIYELPNSADYSDTDASIFPIINQTQFFDLQLSKSEILDTYNRKCREWFTPGITDHFADNSALWDRSWLATRIELSNEAPYSTDPNKFRMHGEISLHCGRPRPNPLLDPDVYTYEAYNFFNGDALRAAGLSTPEQFQSHWLTYGASEGRTASFTFRVGEYLNLNASVRNAFRKTDGSYDLRAVTIDYITAGKANGRTPMAVLSPDVFNVNDYMTYNPDVAAAFNRDASAVRMHWIKYGWSENRRAHRTFSCVPYLFRYPDVRNAMGFTCLAGISHYAQYGKAEGRNGAP